ncbi:hypothetical protein [Heliophilum fasciatum]|uniref:Uncharacterized protein n=1 Tax=Heliophilum fasciatum TaxID=35700 RepID=A0A4R2RG27_9FIRM|nr:hypothetical protein [Heliophilum fasciatum]MCW2278649.1 hypothetical protein [Heliophilum fasciatum]TCP62630.1 hypothetical protein EDD73_12048 [Heliophilum fasciatum]
MITNLILSSEIFQEFIQRHNLTKYLRYIKYLLGTVTFLFFYGLGYSFLYGFYFGKQLNTPLPSLQELVINAVPINFRSILIIGVLYFLNVLLVLYLIYIIGQMKKYPSNYRLDYAIYSVVVFLTMQFCLSIFFLGDISSRTIEFVFYLWITPLIVALMLWWLFNLASRPIPTLSGLFWALIFFLYIGLFIGKIEYFKEINNDQKFLISMILFLILFVSSAFFGRLLEKKLKGGVRKTILVAPLAFIIILVIAISFTKNDLMISSVISFVASAFICIVIYFTPNRINKQNKEQLNIIMTIPTLISLVVLPTTIGLNVVIGSSYMSLISGKYVRTAIPDEVIKGYKCNVEFYINNYTNVLIDSIVVAIDGNVFYVSDKDWNLVVLTSPWVHANANPLFCTSTNKATYDGGVK